MEKVIIYGMGEEFKKNKDKIFKLFDIIGCIDSYKKPEDGWERKYYDNIDQIFDKEFDKVLVCSSKYKDAIRLKLIKKGIKNQQIIFWDELSKISEKTYLELIEDINDYIEKNKNEEFNIREDSIRLITDEKNLEAGNIDRHYFSQDIWGAQKIYSNNPLEHYDIGSSLSGFIAHLLVFRKVNYIDIRPIKDKIPGLNYIYGDAMSLNNIESGTIDSLSSFHAMEHFGLGRYGDAIDPEGHLKAAKSMQRVLKTGGHLYLSVPIGPKNKLIFNVHRIFKIETILELFDECKLLDIAVIDPARAWFQSIEPKEYKSVKEYSCGLFEFIKRG